MKTTTLESERLFMEKLTKEKTHNYQLPKSRYICQKALSVIFAHRNKTVKLNDETVNDLNVIADHYIEKDEPIVITVSLAVCRIPNSLKYIDGMPYPTYAWMHLARYVQMINEKVKKFYQPGIKFLVFDEATLFADLLGMDIHGVEKCIAGSRKIFNIMNAPIEIVEMKKDMFPKGIKPTPVTPDRIYAMACSLPEMKNEEAMEDLYQNKNRNYDEKRRIIGEEIWKRAEYVSGMVNATLAYRKEQNMFGQYLKGEPYIDSCITQKDERLVLSVSSCALINHGLPIVKKRPKYKMIIIPETRIKKTLKNAEPVMLDASEFGGDEGLFTFYYLNHSND